MNKYEVTLHLPTEKLVIDIRNSSEVLWVVTELLEYVGNNTDYDDGCLGVGKCQEQGCPAHYASDEECL
jgi:hypothetical protein